MRSPLFCNETFLQWQYFLGNNALTMRVLWAVWALWKQCLSCVTLIVIFQSDFALTCQAGFPPPTVKRRKVCIRSVEFTESKQRCSEAAGLLDSLLLLDSWHYILCWFVIYFATRLYCCIVLHCCILKNQVHARRGKIGRLAIHSSLDLLIKLNYTIVQLITSRLKRNCVYAPSE